MAADYLQRLFGLDDRTAVVIGGTGTLGGAIAEGLAQAGARVVVAGRSAERGEACVQRIEAAGGRASFQAVDVVSRESMQALCDATSSDGVDVLVNCAGANAGGPYLDADDETWERVLQTNLTSTHLGCQIFGQAMIDAGGGSIINVGSVSSDLPLSRVFAYSASKAAVLSLTRNVAREFGPLGVRVNCLCPGFFPAEQNRKILDEDRIASIMRKTPMDRFGEPEELIGAVLLMASPAAGSFLTGAAIYVDGGFTAMSI